MCTELEVEPEGMTEAALLAHAGVLAGLVRRAEALLVGVATELERVRVPAQRGPRRLAASLVGAGVGVAEARRVAVVARSLEELPALGVGVRSGRVGLANAAVLARADVRLRPELDELVDAAAAMGEAEFAAHVAGRVSVLDAADPEGRARRIRERTSASHTHGPDGMTEIRLRLPTEVGVTVTSAAERIVEEQWRARNPQGHERLPAGEAYGYRLAWAYVELARRAAGGVVAGGSVAGGSTARSGSEPGDDVVWVDRDAPAEVLVVMDYEALLSDVAAARPDARCHLDTGARLPAATLRRLACDALVRPAVLGADGEVLDLGRAVRTASRAQRRAMVARDGPTCVAEGCDRHWTRCRAHHVIPWWGPERGRTNLGELAFLCDDHHHDVHEGGCRLLWWQGRWQLYRADEAAPADATPFAHGLPTVPRAGPGPDQVTAAA